MITSNVLVNAIGWLGTLLVVVSITQSRIVRLHVMNLIASLILTFYNLLIGAIPGVGLNIALMLVNAWRLWALSKPVNILSGEALSDRS